MPPRFPGTENFIKIAIPLKHPEDMYSFTFDPEFPGPYTVEITSSCIQVCTHTPTKTPKFNTPCAMSCIQANSTYSLTNLKGGTCLDLSGGDNVSIIGFGSHNGPNQAWIFESAGAQQTFYIKSVWSGQYLSAAGEPSDGQRVVAAGSPYAWRVEDEQGVDSGVRLLPASNTNYCVDLSSHGNSTPGTPIHLWGRWDGQNQVWKLQKIQ